jgi:signal transduction histidine kinase
MSPDSSFIVPHSSFTSPFRNLSLGIKVLIPPAILITALGVASLLALYGMNRQRAALEAINTIVSERHNLVDAFVNISDRVQSDVFLLSVQRFMNLPKPETQPIQLRLDQGLSDLNVIYGKIATGWVLDQTERSILERMKGPLETFRLQALEAAGVVSDDPFFGVLLVRSAALSFAEFRATLEEFDDHQETRIGRAREASEQEATSIGAAIIALAILVSLLGAFSAIVISTRMISRPIHDMTNLMGRLAGGDLTLEVPDMERRDEIGAMARAVEVFRHNAIEKARAEEQVNQLNLEQEHLLRELELKNQELESIIYVASHDLRSPLVNVQGFSRQLAKAGRELTELLGRPGLPPTLTETAAPILQERIPKALHFINAGAAKMDALLNGLLRLSRLGRATMYLETLDMNRMLETIVSSMSFQIQAAEAMVEVEPLPACQGDAGQINQVFSNLLDNALKYRAPDRPLRIRVTGRVEGAEAIYTVEDTGLGIQQPQMNKVWEVFYRYDPDGSAAGEGLGLSIVRRILDRHNGRAWIESEAGKGSKFWVALPV